MKTSEPHEEQSSFSVWHPLSIPKAETPQLRPGSWKAGVRHTLEESRESAHMDLLLPPLLLWVHVFLWYLLITCREEMLAVWWPRNVARRGGREAGPWEYLGARGRWWGEEGGVKSIVIAHWAEWTYHPGGNVKIRHAVYWMNKWANEWTNEPTNRRTNDQIK